MKAVEITAYDDIDYGRDGTLTRAQVTETIGFHGSWYELDLTEEHHAELVRELGKYLKVAHKPEFPGARPHRQRQPRGNTGLKSAPWERGNAWGAAIRKFGFEHAAELSAQTNKAANRYYYSRELRDLFNAHLAALPPAKRPRWYSGPGA